ncbi:S-layer homology domain-containing protein [Cohnella terricola]|uniref:S-layer homology domain-containing protein n=1 Tax=Cohnella terricola TaxID=1289167 RepID=A0A559JFQ1_9BACL|nr:S-layer homology domain-containing protein [Cohnella terricola]TVX98702.1 S-layer homology domain-containing protein [Cohnella terricola]
MNKISGLILGLAVSLGVSGHVEAAANAQVFKDVSNRHWAKSRIEQAVSKGYVGGYPDGTFHTKQAVTRAEFMKMVVDALKLPHSQGGSPWYQGYVSAALEFGLLDESDSTGYEKPIKRIEMLSILSQVLALEEPYHEYFDIFRSLKKQDLPFEDSELFQKRDLPYIALAYGAGIAGGFPDGTMGVNKTVTRAETVVMMEKWLEARVIDPLLRPRLEELKKVVMQRNT